MPGEFQDRSKIDWERGDLLADGGLGLMVLGGLAFIGGFGLSLAGAVSSESAWVDLGSKAIYTGAALLVLGWGALVSGI